MLAPQWSIRAGQAQSPVHLAGGVSLRL